VSPGDRAFTRRDVIGGAAAAGAGVLLAPGGAAARESGRARVFGQRLGQLVGVSPVITAARSFVLAGVQWAAPSTARIELRARRRGGPWSPWALASVRGHEPDRPVGSSELFGEPVWFGPADELQLRSVGRVSGVRLHFVARSAVAAQLAGARAGDPDAAAAAAAVAAALPLAAPVLPAGPGQPPIIARRAWAGLGNGPAAGPYYGSIELAFVHHTENPNGYSAGQVPAMILAIYDYHRYSRGYFDIAYNFVIDAFGRTWEARAGGIDEPVIGAHAGGYNQVSTGIAVLGSFMFQLPPPPAMTALRRLLAWKLSLHGVPALGQVQVEVDPYDAFYTPFAPGQLVPLPRIAGHRDGDLTDCPGDDLYTRLPSVRTAADRLAGVPPGLTLSASLTTVPPATPVVLAGTLTSGAPAAPIAQAPVQIQTVSGIGIVTTLATVTTGPDGSWTTTLTPSRSTLVRALHAVAPAVVSPLVLVGVTPVLTLALAATAPLRVTGTITPAKRTVTISVLKLSGAHRSVIMTRVVAVRQGTFAARLALPRRARKGSLLIVARTAADVTSSAGASAPLAVTL
jgi:N-acetylmuramoyl-L-alanine amidase